MAELKAYDWNQVTTNIGAVDVLGFAQFEQNGKPYIYWDGFLGEKAEDFLKETMGKLEALSYGEPENVRIVFWFDN